MDDTPVILETGSSEEKIRALEALGDGAGPDALEAVVARLDDGDIRVRGEAFAALVASRSGAAPGELARALGSGVAGVRGAAALILANRGQAAAAGEIAALAGDPHAWVRSCAVGALGRLGAREYGGIILEATLDSDAEVRKAALWAATKSGMEIPEGAAAAWEGESDPEAEAMLSRAGKGR